MSQLDWKKLLGTAPEDLSEQAKDDLYESIAWYKPDSKLERSKLMLLVRVCQEVLKYKAEQVESLVTELDDIASRQGEEEAKNRQELLDELEDLRAQVEYNKRLDREVKEPSGRDDLRGEVVRLEMQNEDLLAELQEREKDLLTEKKETEKLASELANVEREKLELTRELAAIHEENAGRSSSRNIRDSPEITSEKLEELTEIIRQKNRHITQLLSDAEIIEQENNVLREKLSHTRDDLAEATKHIKEMTGEISKLKHLSNDMNNNYLSLLEQNKSLQSQIEELVEQKEEHDRELDNFSINLDKKLNDWKNMIDSKDVEIEKLKEELSKYLSLPSGFHTTQFDDNNLLQALKTQEEQILTLQQELSRATQDIIKSSEVMEKFKINKQAVLGEDSDVKTDYLTQLQEKISELERNLKLAEDDAFSKSQELTEVLIKIREYEAGEYGLAEASNKIKNLQKQIHVRDENIIQLVETCNKLKEEVNNLEEQNMAYHEQLGLPADELINTDIIKSRRRDEQLLLKSLNDKLEKQEDQIIELKMKNRKLQKLNNVSSEEVKVSSSESLEIAKESFINKHGVEEFKFLEDKLDNVIKENDSLRKGMHEILLSIKNQDIQSLVDVKSECLERLLEALDSRHISGWYHPAMRLQAQVHNLEGNNQELRNLIKLLRKEEVRKSLELNEAQSRIQKLEENSVEVNSDVVPETIQSPQLSSERKLLTNKEVIIKQAGIENELEEEKAIKTKLELELKELEVQNKKEIENLQTQIIVLNEQINVYKNYYNIFESGECELKRAMSETVQNTALVKSDLVKLERNNKYSKYLVKFFKDYCCNLRKKFFDEQEYMLRKIIDLQNEKTLMTVKVLEAHEKLNESVSLEEFNNINISLIEMSQKYRNALNNMTLLADGTPNVESLEEEIKNLKKAQSELLEELKGTKEKLYLTESILNCSVKEVVTQDDFNKQVTELSTKLAAVEVREINEKQKCQHLEKLSLILKSEVEQVENRNKELQIELNVLNEMIFKLQDVEKNLHQQLQNSCSLQEFAEMKENFDNLHKKYKLLQVDKERVEELFDLSQKQFHNLEHWKMLDKLCLDNFTEQILILQSVSDEKTTIARFSHELLTLQMKNADLSTFNNNLQNKISQLTVNNICLDKKFQDEVEYFLQTKKNYFCQIIYLLSVITDLRKMYTGALPLMNLEKVNKMKLELIKKKKDIDKIFNNAKQLELDNKTKCEEMGIQLDSLEELKQSLMSGQTKKLIAWHNKYADLRLQHSRTQHENEFLKSELKQFREHVERLSDDIINMEEENIKNEKKFEEKQVLWEQAQVEFLTLMKDNGYKKQVVEGNKDAKDVVRDIGEDLEEIRTLNETVEHYKIEIKQLKEKLALMSKSETGGNDTKQIFAETSTSEVSRHNQDDKTERTALKLTVDSLQTIIKQKEETITKFQNLLKDSREEHLKSSVRQQDEIKKLHSALTDQTQAFNKLKNNIRLNQPNCEPVEVAVIEKYITKIQELEEELTESNNTMSTLQSELYNCKQENKKFKKLADERLVQLDLLNQRLDEDHLMSLEDMKHADSLELEESKSNLIQNLETQLQDAHAKMSEQYKLINELKRTKLPASSDTREATDDSKFDKLERENENLNSKLQDSVLECESLKQKVKHLTLRQKRPNSYSSMETKSSVSSKEETLQNKIKNLEELLKLSKTKEEENYEKEMKRLKSTEEVTRWDERKKWQQTTEKLNARLKSKENEIEVLKVKNEGLRNMVQRFEKEKNLLEIQLKSEKANEQVEKWEHERRMLQDEIANLKFKLEDQYRHSGGLGAALLEERLEFQERKIIAMELANQGEGFATDELIRLQTANATLEKANLKLESENLQIKLNLEKTRSQVKRLSDQIEFLERHVQQHDVTNTNDYKRIISEQDMTIFELKKTIDKLKCGGNKFNKTSSLSSSSSSSYNGVSERHKREMNKLREEHKKLQNQYFTTVEKCTMMQEQLDKYQLQIRLLEEKDLADTITKTNIQQRMSELTQEVNLTKSQLLNKTQLLEKVKNLLKKAAAKEKVLHNQVSVLRSLVPHDVLNNS